VGGNISSATGVINGFIAAGYHVDIVTDSYVPTLSKDSDKLTTIFYPCRFLRSKIPDRWGGLLGRVILKIDSLLFQLAMKIKISKLMKSNDYQLAYMRASFNGHAVVNLMRQFQIPLVLEVNKPLSMGIYKNSDALKWPEKDAKIEVPFSESQQYDTAKLITVDSSLRAKWILDFVDAAYKEKMIVNPNGVDVNMFCPSEPDKTLKYELELLDGEILVGMASSFRWYNDIEEMCQIFKYVVNKQYNIKFLIITGDRKKKVEIEDILFKHGMTKYVKLLLQIPFSEMPKYLSCCDILISHFNFHGKWPHNCSIKHLEYLSLGKPAVATDVGEVNFAVEHNINGLLCVEGDIKGFGESILRLSSDEKLRIKFGTSGRLKAVKDLTWDKNVQNITNLL
jgi:glycosyltransferase involved in cell wall biosynthesis